MKALFTPPERSSEHKIRPGAPIRLEFGSAVSDLVRKRITYALRVFAAIFDHRIVEGAPGQEAICCTYGNVAPRKDGDKRFQIPALYRPSRDFATKRLSGRTYAGEDFYLLYGVDTPTNNPDWLGEIFEWLSSSHELSLTRRDPLGRIDYADTIFSQQEISPRKPHATMLMAWLENCLRNGSSVEELPKAPSPVPSVDHIVVCSHDIDFHYTNKISVLVRTFKNLGISFRLYRSKSFFRSNLQMIAQVLAGNRVGDYLPRLLEACEKCGISSTMFVVAGGKHRRDPNYHLEDISASLLEARSRGFTLSLHGSYGSIVEEATLAPETSRFEAVLRSRPLGNRQHWLRFDKHEKLFNAIESAGLVYDSSLGFPEMPGFRNGASFAFPPYDFLNEKPHEFLEIPLVLMDGSVEAASRNLHEDPQNLTDEILRASRRWAWGGVAALWHNPVEPLSVPDEINGVFWNCVQQQRKHREKWMSAEQFLSSCLGRYQDAGLLKGARIDA
jgi:hypothetical protein